MKPIDSRALWILLTKVLIMLVTEFKYLLNKLNWESQIKASLEMQWMLEHSLMVLIPENYLAFLVCLLR